MEKDLKIIMKERFKKMKPDLIIFGVFDIVKGIHKGYVSAPDQAAAIELGAKIYHVPADDLIVYEW